MKKLTYEEALAGWIFAVNGYMTMNDDNSINYTDYDGNHYCVHTDNQVFRFDEVAQQWLYVD